jgi:hypothetical protein
MSVEELQQKYTAQGEVVRKIKTEKGDKNAIQAEVAKLLAIKQQLADLGAAPLPAGAPAGGGAPKPVDKKQDAPKGGGGGGQAKPQEQQKPQEKQQQKPQDKPKQQQAAQAPAAKSPPAPAAQAPSSAPAPPAAKSPPAQAPAAKASAGPSQDDYVTITRAELEGFERRAVDAERLIDALRKRLEALESKGGAPSKHAAAAVAHAEPAAAPAQKQEAKVPAEEAKWREIQTAAGSHKFLQLRHLPGSAKKTAIGLIDAIREAKEEKKLEWVMKNSTPDERQKFIAVVEKLIQNTEDPAYDPSKQPFLGADVHNLYATLLVQK